MLNNLAAYIHKIQEQGDAYFTMHNALQALQISKSALLKAISRKKQKKELASPCHGLYIIIKPEHRFRGCLPEKDVLPIIMGYLDVPYYVSFLSAAKFYGAAHHKLMVTQVVVSQKHLRNIRCGHMHLLFTYKNKISNIPVHKIVSNTGFIKVATPEVMVMDLLSFFHNRTISVNQIANVLNELIEKLSLTEIITLAENLEKYYWVQRLGYILERFVTMNESRKHILIASLKAYLATKKLYYKPLSSRRPVKGFAKDNTWKIIENTTIESDL